MSSSIDIIKNMITDNIRSVAIYFIIIGALIYLYYQMYLASNDITAGSRRFNLYLVVIVIPIILIFYALMNLSTTPTNQMYMLLFGAIIAFSFFGLFYFLRTNISEYIFNRYVVLILTVLIILIGLSIIFTIFSGTLRRLEGWVGFASNLIFFIPCLVSDFVTYFLKDLKESPAAIVVLFLIEIGLILAYFFMVPVLNTQIYPEKVYILNDSQFLNEETVYSKDVLPANNKYALSMWIYINAMPHSKTSYSKETPIFFYGVGNDTPHIKIAYANNALNSEEFIIYLREKKYTIKLPLQKWNNFVINYNTYDEKISHNQKEKTIYKTEIDLFVNGVLERSHSIDEDEDSGEPEQGNTLITGSTDDKAFQNGGLYGAISNISYYKNPLTEMAIINDYNFLSLKNPPLDDM